MSRCWDLHWCGGRRTVQQKRTEETAESLVPFLRPPPSGRHAQAEGSWGQSCQRFSGWTASSGSSHAAVCVRWCGEQRLLFALWPLQQTWEQLWGLLARLLAGETVFTTPARIWTHNLSIKSPALCQQAILAPSCKFESWQENFLLQS